MRARSISLALSLSFAACGGGAAATPPAASPTADEPTAPASPAAQCIAIASAKREKRADEPAKIGARHVLVKYEGAKRGEGFKRTREEACLRAMEARDKIRAGADFDEVVREYSDEAGADTRGGSIGTVERGDVAPPFADAAFELDINQLSDVVETDFGFHVILRTE